MNKKNVIIICVIIVAAIMFVSIPFIIIYLFFSVFIPSTANITQIGTNYAHDKSNVYYGCFTGEFGKYCTKIPGVDYNTFQQIGNTAYAKDKYRVYYQDKIIPTADPQTFTLLFYKVNNSTVASEYSLDSKNVYFENKLVTTSNRNNFSILHINQDYQQGSYAGDGIHVFYNGQLLVDSDFSKWNLLAGFYSEDSIHEYYQNNKIAADANTFKIYTKIPDNNEFAYDKFKVYKFGIPTNIGPESFNIVPEKSGLSYSYIIDKTHVYLSAYTTYYNNSLYSMTGSLYNSTDYAISDEKLLYFPILKNADPALFIERADGIYTDGKYNYDTHGNIIPSDH